ncbi:MAG: 2-oxoglutarate dehydrogenase E1 component, partial [Hyphomicrobiales bacterium]|nr:2-oxoglutarate dehydrogenase E1 component [Hyphomicrobiales bacterium]
VNAAYIEDLYSRYQENAGSVTADWRAFFSGLKERKETVIEDARGPSWKRANWPEPANGEYIAALAGDWATVAEKKIEQKIASVAHEEGVELSPAETMKAVRDSIRALMLIRSYRVRGHLAADLDPLSLNERLPHPELQPETYGFTPEDMDRLIYLDKVLGLEMATVRQIVEILKRTYCTTIGVEFMHISDPVQKAWLQERIEGPDKDITFTDMGKKAILAKLIEGESFEKFLDKKYTGTKRFGLDGAESIIPALEQIIKRGGQLGVREIVLGMAHRGRLNVLANVMSKPYRAIFHEFKGGSANPDDVEGSGDVKYHLGASSDREFDGNNIHLSLTANPSHLEIVDPVVLGKVRAKQDHLYDKDRTNVLPLLLHGDAAFAGQGVVAECFGLSGLTGHRTGGSLHFIINNQIGFTTSPRFARSSPYPSDVARMIEAPIFHVNGDDPEAVVHVAKVATEFRQQFHKPVVMDMFCYRRFGHNEGDEPAFTQPVMYKRIREHPSVTDIYGDRLIEEGLLEKGEVDELRNQVMNHLEEEFEIGENYRPNKADWLDGRWSGLERPEEGPRKGETAVALDTLKKVGTKLAKLPDDFNAHRTIDRLFKRRAKMIEDGKDVDWAMAESLAFGTLVNEGFPVRLSGQDVERGTFSQRHVVLIDQTTEKKYRPVNHISPNQATMEVINSMLSEEAVLGFEYGYSLAEPMALVLWEAQFGDFANGAQVIIDQFLAAGERKWLRMSGLVMLLPHGYEGQGPEHSSARLERYLQLSAEDNWQVAYCTTPANYFHILRRQMHRKFRKPLILMTPKSLLRHKRVLSDIKDFGPGTTFHRVLWDGAEVNESEEINLVPDNEIKRVVMCTGKVYYDLFEEREKRKLNDIYLMRLEQLYPFPARALIQELGRFPQAQMYWCQEEPKNMGAWSFVEPNIEWVLDHIGAGHKRPGYVGRAASASTATGLMSKHLAELKAFLDEALTL